MEKEREKRTNETRGTGERVGTPSGDTNVGDLTELGEGLRARGTTCQCASNGKGLGATHLTEKVIVGVPRQVSDVNL